MLDRLFEKFVAYHKIGKMYTDLQTHFRRNEIKEAASLEELLEYTANHFSKHIVENLEIFISGWEETKKKFKEFIVEKEEAKKKANTVSTIDYMEKYLTADFPKTTTASTTGSSQPSYDYSQYWKNHTSW